MLVSTFFAPFCLFPGLLTYINEGRSRGLGVLFFGLMASFAFAGSYGLVIYFIAVVFVSVIVAEFILSGKTLAFTIFTSSALILAVFALAVFGASLYLNMDPLAMLTLKVQESLTVIEQSMGPDGLKQILLETGFTRQEFAASIAQKIPGVVCVGVVAVILFNLLFVGRFNLKLRQQLSVHNMMKFKLPEYLLWPTLMIGAFYVYTTSKYNTSVTLTILGAFLLKGALIFYFVQGLAIVYLFIIFSVRTSFIRSLMMSMAVIFAYLFVTIIGFFDTWFDFRKYLKKQEGDKPIWKLYFKKM